MEIRSFAPQDFDAVVSTMTEAFAEDALYRYFVEDKAQRQRFLTKFMAFRLRYGLAFGTVLVTDDCQGVAIWLAPGHAMTPWDLLRFGGMKAMMSCSKESRKRLMGFNNFADERMAAAAPARRWHLSPICVAPACQRKGYGQALVVRGQELMGSEGSPCCLETQSEGAVKFYEACGFRTLSRDTVPGSELSHTVMQWP